MKISIDKFAEIWNSSSSRKEVSEKTGYSVNTLNIYVSKFRKEGFELKILKPSLEHLRFVSKISFIEIWNKSTSMTEVTDLTGYTKSSAQVNASLLRKEGYYLKHFGKNKKRALK